jgi:hypothetical protein
VRVVAEEGPPMVGLGRARHPFGWRIF